MFNILLKLSLTLVIIYFSVKRYINFEEIVFSFILNLFLLILMFSVILFEFKFESLNLYYSVILFISLIVTLKKNIFFFRIFVSIFNTFYKSLKNNHTLKEILQIIMSIKLEMKLIPNDSTNDKKTEIDDD